MVSGERFCFVTLNDRMVSKDGNHNKPFFWFDLYYLVYVDVFAVADWNDSHGCLFIARARVCDPNPIIVTNKSI